MTRDLFETLKRRRGRLARLSAYAGALIVAAGTGVFALTSYQQVLERKQTLLDAQAAQLAAHVDRSIEAAGITLRMIAGRHQSAPWARIARSSTVWRDLQDSAERLPQVAGIWLIDQNGQLRQTSAGFPAPTLDLFDRAYFQRLSVKPADRLRINAPIQGRLSDAHLVPITLPILTGLGNFRGLAAAALDTAYYRNLLTGDQTCTACTAAMLMADGTELVTSAHAGPGLAPAPAIVTRAIAQGGKLRSHEIAPNGRHYLLAVTGSSRYPGAIVVALPKREVLIAWLREAGPLLAPGLMAAALLMLAARRSNRFHDALARTHADLLARSRDLDDARRAAEAQERAERQLRRDAAAASRAKSEFLATMSHELRTPLNAIIGFSDLIAQRAFGDDTDRYADYAADINTSGQHLLDLINDILDISKIEAGKYTLQEEEIDLDALIARCSKLVQHRIDPKRVTLLTPPTNLQLVADPRALKQSLLNLMSNAAKFTTDGEIRVEAHLTGGMLMLSVIDSGPGMSPSELQQALQPFGQVAASLTRNHEGTGLGLTIVQRLCTLHDGRLAVDTSRGQGTRASICLPASRVCDPPSAALPPIARVA